MKVRTLVLLLVILILTAACSMFTTPAPEDPEVLFKDGKTALQNLDSYRYVTELKIEAPDSQPRTLRVEGKRINDPLSQEVRVTDAETQALFARWIRINDSYWIYDPAGDSWSSVPASTAQQSLASISFIDPAEIWASIDPNGLGTAEFIGNEEINGHETVHYQSSLENAPQLPEDSQLQNASRVEQDAWFDTESDVPIRTRFFADGAGSAGNASYEVVTTLQDLNSDEIVIEEPQEQIPTLGAGTSPRLQSLKDGTELPVHPDAEQTLGQLSDQALPLVHNFDQVSRSDNVAVQVYTVPLSVEELESYFRQTLEDEDWTFDQRVSSGPTEKAVSMVFSREQNNAQVVLIPMENGRSLIITTLQ